MTGVGKQRPTGRRLVISGFANEAATRPGFGCNASHSLFMSPL